MIKKLKYISAQEFYEECKISYLCTAFSKWKVINMMFRKDINQEIVP